MGGVLVAIVLTVFALSVLVLARAAPRPSRVPPARPRRDVRAELDTIGAEVDALVFRPRPSK